MDLMAWCRPCVAAVTAFLRRRADRARVDPAGLRRDIREHLSSSHGLELPSCLVPVDAAPGCVAACLAAAGPGVGRGVAGTRRWSRPGTGVAILQLGEAASATAKPQAPAGTGTRRRSGRGGGSDLLASTLPVAALASAASGIARLPH